MSARRADDTGGTPFFDLSARYTIAPGATLADLLNDCNCLLESGIGGLDEQGGDGFTHAQWASLYALRQAKAVFDEVYRRAFAGEQVERGAT